MKIWTTLTLGLAFFASAGQPTAAAETLTLSAPEAHRMAAAGEIVLVDIRTPQEWKQTGVPAGARRISMQHPEGAEGFLAEVLKAVDGNRNAPIALICRTGNRTTHAQRFLIEQGFTRVYNVTEGMAGSQAGPGWLKRGLPVE